MNCCKDCRSTTRALKYPGPRCLACHRAIVKIRKDLAHEKRVQKIYGLEPGDYQRIYEFQGGKCYICRRATGASRRLSVDHDHKTGKVRGLLCRPCNDVLGHLRDDPWAVRRALDYLSRPPADHLGIDAVHEDNRTA